MEIKPFRIVHYPFKADILERVVCPPYDKLADEQIKSFRQGDPHNFVWTILGDSLQDHDYHKEAANTLRGWLKGGVLVQEKKESLLVYRQKYTSPLTGDSLVRTSFFGLLQLPEEGEAGVLPHERTFSDHKADRLQLYQAVSGNPEPIFVLYSDPDGEVRNRFEQLSPEVAFDDFQGHRNELALVDSPEIVSAVRDAIAPQKLLIADGHHRFETGMNYRKIRRDENPEAKSPQPHDYILVCFAALEDPGVVILPTHRLVKDVTVGELGAFLDRAGDFFEIEETGDEPTGENIHKLAIEIHEGGQDAFGLATHKELRLLRIRDREKLKSLLPPDVESNLRDLPVVWLHQVLLPVFLGVKQEEGAPNRMAYVRTGQEIHAGLHRGGYDLCFLLRGTRPDEVKQVAESGVRMPQKSTDFFPKILSGLAVYLYP